MHHRFSRSSGVRLCVPTLLLTVSLCAGCSPSPRAPTPSYLHISPAILVLAQQAEIARLERHDPAMLSTPEERVDRHARLDLVLEYRGRARTVLEALRAVGAHVVAHPVQAHWIEAWVPARHVASLARIPGVVAVRFPSRAHGRI
jgi:hypothetical protein